MRPYVKHIIAFFCVITILVFGCSKNNSDKDKSPAPGITPDINDINESYEELTEEEILRIESLKDLSYEKVYNIQDFGAVVNEDSTQAIQSAIDTLQKENGGIVYFPAGIYYINDVITFKKGQSAAITFIGESSGDFRSKISVNNSANTDGILVESDNISFAHLDFMNKMTDGSTMRLAGDKATLYCCRFRNYAYGYADSLLRVCGTNAVMYALGFTAAYEEATSINFTKFPGIASRNNKLVDTHIGGEFDGILVDSKDDSGAPENILMTRLTFLNYRGGQLDIRSVNGLIVTNSMMDQGYVYCIRIRPEGQGVCNVIFKENYISAAFRFSDNSVDNYGILIEKSVNNAKIDNIKILDNMIYYNRYGISCENDNLNAMYISGNSVGDSTYSLKIKNLKNGIITSNYFSSKVLIEKMSGENIVRSNIINTLCEGCDLGHDVSKNTITTKE